MRVGITMQILIFSPTCHSPMRRTGASRNDREPSVLVFFYCKAPTVRRNGKCLRTFRDDNDCELAWFELEVVVFGADRGLAVDKLEQFFTGHGEAPTLGEATARRVQNQTIDILASH